MDLIFHRAPCSFEAPNLLVPLSKHNALEHDNAIIEGLVLICYALARRKKAFLGNRITIN